MSSLKSTSKILAILMSLASRPSLQQRIPGHTLHAIMKPLLITLSVTIRSDSRTVEDDNETGVWHRSFGGEGYGTDKVTQVVYDNKTKEGRVEWGSTTDMLA